MGTFSVDFLGCKVSYADAQELRERLAADGHVEADGENDVAIVNTCCVTHEAVRKSRQAARRAARGSRRVFVTGCAANLAGAFDGLPENVVVVALPSERTVDFVAATVGALGCTRDDVGFDRVRAFVKIQDGCSFSCHFCVIPQVRGPSRSRSFASVRADVQRRVAQGHREVVLSGVNLGCYRDRSAGYDLARLVRELGATPGLVRLRLSSIEVNHLTDELLSAMRETPTVARHLHVPLQSGDDRVLRAMGRRYGIAGYLRRVGRAGDFNLTTDAIVGFPGEDEAAFSRTLTAIEQAGITKVHVFPYSPRPGTRTGGDDTVSPQEKRARSARLRAASHDACVRHWRAKLGSEDVVLVDREGRGYGGDYSPWRLMAPVGALARVRAAAVTDEGIVGV